MSNTDSTTLIFPGSFDPFTRGHENVVRRALCIANEVRIVVAKNSSKQTIFSPEENVALIRQVFTDTPAVSVDEHHGLVAHYAKEHHGAAFLRGIRTIQDYEYEVQLASANRSIAGGIETLFIPCDPQFAHISSSLIKDLVRLGETAEQWLHPVIEAALREKLQ